MRVSAKPPEKRSIFERIENSALFNAASRWAVKEYSKGLLKVEDYNLTSERGKQNIMQEHSVATIGVILYEFATGSGPSSRYFDETSLFTQQVKQSPGIEWMVSKYAAQYNSDSLVHISRDLNQYNVRYQFSPMLVPVRTNTWLFSIQEHLKTLEYKNLSQILLGSFNADILYVDDQTIQVHLWNRTSKKSLFGGFGRRLQRPLLLGTVKQHIVFELSIAEINSILKK
ncbi:MAG: hypothetical protein JJ975_04315 [Bacteroidia bacterium]|nr:hypothetical protein [Bacteroidia bacterium]